MEEQVKEVVEQEQQQQPVQSEQEEQASPEAAAEQERPEDREEVPATPVRRVENKNSNRAKAQFFRSELLKAGMLPIGGKEGDALDTREWMRRRNAQEAAGVTDADIEALDADYELIEEALGSGESEEREIPEPTPEERQQSHDAHVQALTRLGLPQEAAETRAKAAADVEKRFPEHATRFREAADYTPDLEDLRQVALSIPITPGLRSSIAQLPNSADVCIALARNPALAEQLNYMPRGLMQRALQEFASDLAALDGGVDSEGPTQAVKDAYNQRAEEARARHADFDQALDQEFDATPEQQETFAHVEEAILEMEDGPEVAYFLAKNPDERADLLSMSPRKAVAELGRIAASLGEEESEESGKPVSRPIRPVRRAAASVVNLSDDLPIERWMELRNKQVYGG